MKRVVLIPTGNLELGGLAQARGQLDQAQPRLVVEHVRAAVRRYLRELQVERSLHLVDRMAARLQEAASFHLVRPMIEAWFFGSSLALPAAGVPAGREPRLRADTDPEEFQTEDAAFSADQGQDCAAHQALDPDERKRKENKLPWMKGVPRELHPKAYLSWLCRDPAQRCCSSYQEVRGGVQALKALPWEDLLSVPDRYHYVGALLADIADFLQAPLPFVHSGTYHKALTSRFHQPKAVAPVLRNL